MDSDGNAGGDYSVPPGFTLFRYDAVGSTNDTARDLAAGGCASGSVVLATMQSAGRGRQGRTWISPSGNLYFSLVLKPDRARPLTDVGFVAALAVSDAIDRVLSGARVALKWPNDILVDGRKLAGILPEVVAPKSPTVILGIGINVASAPAGTPYPATSLREHGAADVTAESLLVLVLRELQRWTQVWEGGGFAAIRPVWLKRAHGVGQHCSVRNGTGWTAGKLLTMDESGALVLETSQGIALVTAGEVAFGGAEKDAPQARLTAAERPLK